MNKLTKAQEATKDDLVKRLNEAKAEVEKAFGVVVNYMDNELASAVAAYNDIVGEVEGFRDELVGDMENYYDERSEKWQEGDAGSSYQEWKGEWEGLDTTIVDDATVPDEPTMGHADELEQLSNEVNG